MNSINRKLYQYGSMVLCLLMMLTLFPVSAFAESETKNIVRVGAFEDTYNVVTANGERSGYGYEYLQNIAGYAGWSYDYVASSWDDCFTKLENGEIDILGGISYTDERAGTMLFSEQAMGEERYYIYTDASEQNLSAADLHSFDGKNIGVLLDHTPETVLNEWEQKHGVQMHHVNITSIDEILEKLASDEIDCFVSVEESHWQEQDISPVTNIGGSEIYFVINKNRPDIKESLDSAMRRIHDDNPFYTDDLYRRYLSAQSHAFLSGEEKEWLEKHGTIRIGYLNNDTGVSVMNPNTGEVTGVITDYVQLARDCLQGTTLEFTLSGYDTREEQLEALHNDEIDLIFHVSQNPYSAETNGFSLSDTLFTFNLVAVTARGSFDEGAKNTVAVRKGNFSLKAYISYNYPKWKVYEYETKSAAVKAMQDGEVDCFVCNSAVVSDYLRNKKLHSIFLTKPANVSFAVQLGKPVLLSIMNKTLASIPVAKLSGAVVSYSSATRKVTIVEFAQDNLLWVTCIVIAVLLFILLVILVFLKRSKRAETEATQLAAHAMELNQKLEEKQKELQTALVEAQSANRTKTAFLNNMSHDIRTPINGIIGMLGILEKNEDDPGRMKDCLNKIDMSARLLLSLINDVLDMAKLESGTVVLDNEPIELDQVCNEVTSTVKFQAENIGITVTGEHDDYRGVYVLSSEVHLKKILMNLFTNSIKYNKPNGSIYMSMKTLSETKDSITIEFKISDNGIGMSEDFVKNKLFTPFVQADNSPRTSYKGTGLGMPIVKAIVEQMNGSITVESKLGEGSCFTVVIPFTIDHCAPAVRPDAVAADITGLRLLLVEDNELNAEIAQFMLTENGAQVDTAKNGLVALKKFEAAQPGTYDAILMDMMMPEMDGLTATRKIRRLESPDAKTIPIIAMTANAFVEDVEKCLAAGMNAHLAKPLEVQKVTATIARYCVKSTG